MAKDRTKGSWKPGQSGNPHGFPRLTAAAAAIKISSKEHIHELYWKLLNASAEEIREILSDPKVPILEACILKGILKDMETGETKVVERMMDRVIGKPKEMVEHSGQMGIVEIVAASYSLPDVVPASSDGLNPDGSVKNDAK